MMNYKGFIGVVEYDDDARIFSGEVINTRTVITFQGTTVDEIEKEFPFQKNKMAPNMFLEVLDKLKVRLNETFTEDDYVEYKQWHSFIEYKINSIKQGSVNKK